MKDKHTKEILNHKGCEIELSKGKESIFFKVFFDPDSIWIDIGVLPHSAFLCACLDGQPLIECESGESGLNKRQFLDIEWLINEWEGDPYIIEALKFQRSNIQADLPRLREKYCCANGK